MVLILDTINKTKNIKGELKMSVSLQKGQRVSLVKDNNPVKNLVVGLGWDMNKLGKKIMT